MTVDIESSMCIRKGNSFLCYGGFKKKQQRCMTLNVDLKKKNTLFFSTYEILETLNKYDNNQIHRKF